MGTLGTFDTFTTARLGIYAAQKGLAVTGNNISNINTAGYTRQRIQQVSLKTGAHDTYQSIYDNHVGTGALVTGINQIRDPYLDIRYRNTSSDVGYYDTMLGGMQEIASILDEVGRGTDGEIGDGLLYAQIQKVAEALRQLSADPTEGNDTLVRSAAESLVGLFNKYAERLETQRTDTVDSLHQDIKSVNEILTNIRNLNESIRDNDLSGDPALELRDERNRQIDALSEYMHINVIYTMEDVGGGKEVEKLTITLGDSNPDPKVTTDSSVLIDGQYGTQISIKQVAEANPKYDPTAAAGTPESFKYLKPDGTGTNNESEANHFDNENYDLVLGKLLDAKNREWEAHDTQWIKGPTDATGGAVGSKAVYKYTIKESSGWTTDPATSITIAGQRYEVGTDIPLATANNKNLLAQFVASKLKDNGNYSNYNIAAVNGVITFTAKNIGAVPNAAAGITAPTPPLADITTGDTTITGQFETVSAGQDRVLPAGVKEDPVGSGIYVADPPPVSPDADGNEISINWVPLESGWYQVIMTTQHTNEVELDDNDIMGSLQATRELLTEKGEFATTDYVQKVDENAANKRGIPYYQLSLDLLARQFAEHYNSLNQGYKINESGNYIKKDGTELQLANSPISKTKGLTQAQKDALIADGCVLEDGTPDLNRWLGANDAYKAEKSGILFSNSGDNNDPTGITASNISIAANWSNRDVQIVTTFVQLYGEDGKPLPNTTQNENVNHMITRISDALIYNPQDLVKGAVSNKVFQGSFNDMFSNMMTVEGNYERIVKVKLLTSSSTLVELDSSREGVSGVDLNDEAMNMMQYQKAYSAACRMMTVIDEALDRLINNTGIAGR